MQLLQCDIRHAKADIISHGSMHRACQGLPLRCRYIKGLPLGMVGAQTVAGRRNEPRRCATLRADWLGTVGSLLLSRCY